MVQDEEAVGAGLELVGCERQADGGNAMLHYI
jgi:hypothetical protein